MYCSKPYDPKGTRVILLLSRRFKGNDSNFNYGEIKKGSDHQTEDYKIDYSESYDKILSNDIHEIKARLSALERRLEDSDRLPKGSVNSGNDIESRSEPKIENIHDNDGYHFLFKLYSWSVFYVTLFILNLIVLYFLW